MQRLRVDTSRVLARFAESPIGISVDYLRDHDANRPAARPIREALREMGVRWLRYPGGGKSDMHLWSKPPYDRPDPQVFPPYRQWAEGHTLLDFDDFIECARAVGATPFVVTGYKRADRGITKEQYLENAVEWVRYANLRKGYGVRHWEIGNENWLLQATEPEEMAGIVAEFSRAMKAVDPSILIGSNGFDLSWWEKFLPVAAPHLDFLTLSNYPCSCWMGYDHYRTNAEVVVTDQARFAAEGIARFAPEADRERLFVIVTELNSMDYAKDGWPNRNNLGHALVTVEIFGRLLQSPRVRAAMLWNTRWVEPEPDTIWYALDAMNRILPAGRAVAVWGQFLRDTMVACERTDAIVTFATRSSVSGEVNVLLTNKDTTPARVELQVPAGDTRSARLFRLHGSGPDDMHPTWEELPATPVAPGGVLSLDLPAVSLTVVSAGSPAK